MVAACLFVALLPSSLLALEGPVISRIQIDAYLKNGLERFAQEDSRDWEDRMYVRLRKTRCG